MHIRRKILFPLYVIFSFKLKELYFNYVIVIVMRNYILLQLIVTRNFSQD